jgi:hypothetical protein
MSFRKKNKDMKIAYAEDSQPKSKSKSKQQDQQQASNEPPDGTSAEVMEWVGDDPQKAQAALDKEQSHERPRSGLSEDLQEVIDKGNSTSDSGDSSETEAASTSTTNEDGDTTTTTTTTTETETNTSTSNE